MSTRLPRWKTAIAGALMLLLALSLPVATAQDNPQASPEAAAAGNAPATAVASPPSDIPQAEQLYREGVSLYSREMYREALNAFNRALAVDPNHENAKKMVQKAEGKIQMSAVGAAPSSAQTFEVLGPEAVAPESEGGAPKNADELKYERVKELMTEGQRLLENKKFSKAKELFEQILIIDVGNKTATRLLAQATLGAYDVELEKAWVSRELDRKLIREATEVSKQLPEGADAKGVKPPQISIPVEEEEYEKTEVKSEIEIALDAPVSIEFQDEHINNIVEFVAEYVGINIMVDSRVVGAVKATPPPTTTTGAPTAGLPGGLPTGAPVGLGAPAGGLGAPVGGFNPTSQESLRALSQAQQLQGPTNTGLTGDQVTTGYVPYIKLDDVPLRSALRALLRPLNLTFSVQPGFLWISTPEKIRTETFEELETRIYELRNAGAETLFKIVVQNSGGQGGTSGLGGGGGLGGGSLGGGSLGG
ncbi:MAG: tetratricopeptide repeat protein, partial [Candidatus Hydrogenedentales bacterium]